MTDAPEYRPYGRTGEKVTGIGLGGAYLDKHSLAEGVATVRRALELGINYFDTAPAYGDGASQVVLGSALAGREESHMLATKLGYLPTPADHQSVDVLRAQLSMNLQALRRDSVDVLQVHLAEWACWWRDGAAHEELLSADERCDFANAPVMRVLHEAKRRGLCRYIGMTADGSDVLAHILPHVDVDTCMVAYDYTLLARRARESVLPLARDRGMAYMAAGVIKTILPPAGKSPDAGISELARASGLSLPALAIRYLLGDPAVATILVGAATVAELEESVLAARSGPLPADLHQAAEALTTV